KKHARVLTLDFRMGKRGPARTPTKALKLAGSRRADEREEHEPQPPPGAPDMPGGLSDGAVAEWDRMVAVLGDTPGLLTKVDGPALALLCRSLDRVAKLYKWTLRNKSVAQGTTGQPIQHPKVKEYERERDHCAGLLGQFGLTPAARSRVAVAEPKRTTAKGRFFTA
ncbi:hypothetical protein LCGC14_0714500, partial [marine sediment metagenome]